MRIALPTTSLFLRHRAIARHPLEAVAQPVFRYWKGTVLTVPNRCSSKLRLQPLRANDGPQGLKPPSFGSGFGTTKVVPLRRSEEVLQQLLLLLFALLWCGSVWASPPRRPFADSYSTHQAERTRTYDLQHVLLRLRLDETNQSVAGTSTLALRPLQPGLEQIEVESAELQIQSVT